MDDDKTINPVQAFFFTAGAIKGAAETMDRPFFSIDKRKRKKGIEYRAPDGSIFVNVTGNPIYGLATIWDSDILNFAVTEMTRRDPKSNLPGNVIFTTPHALLEGIHRDTGGKSYKELDAAIQRLRQTDVHTNIRASGRVKEHRFNYLGDLTLTSDLAGSQASKTLALVLPNWIVDGVGQGNVLTLSPQYYDIKGGLDRVIYRIARKHAGMQRQGFLIRMKVLHEKTGTEANIYKFTYNMREIIAADILPEYTLTETTTADGSVAVHFIHREFAALDLSQDRKKRRLQVQRDVARMEWIDTGRDPRTFDQTWDGWIDLGRDPEKFGRAHAQSPRSSLL